MLNSVYDSTNMGRKLVLNGSNVTDLLRDYNERYDDKVECSSIDNDSVVLTPAKNPVILYNFMTTNLDMKSTKCVVQRSE